MTLAARLAAWQQDPEGLEVWRGYRAQEHRAIAFGLGDIVTRLASGVLAPAAAVDVFDHLYHDTLIRDFRQRLPMVRPSLSLNRARPWPPMAPCAPWAQLVPLW